MPRRLALGALALSLGLACATPSSPKPGDGKGRQARMSLERFAGGTYELAAQHGDVIVVNFFATWCLPCIDELPMLQRLQDRYRRDGLQVVAVAMDVEGRVVVTPFLEVMPLNFPVLLADERVYEGRTPFGPITTLPTTAVVGRDGIIVGAHVGILEEQPTEALLVQLLARDGG